MSTPLLIFVTLAYAYVTVDLARRRQWPQALMFFGYALANIGIIWALAQLPTSQGGR